MSRITRVPHAAIPFAASLLCFAGVAVADESAQVDDIRDGRDPVHVVGDPDPAYERASAVVDVTRRVIGGNLSAPGQFPSAVALLDPGMVAPIERQFCGGTVIDERWVLTAAHCLHDAFGYVAAPAALRVVEGTLDLASESVEELDVMNVYVHPDYDHASRETYHDIALLEMSTVLESTPALLFDGNPEDFVGETAVIVGWGAIEYLTPQYVVYPDALHHASVPLVSREACNAQQSYNGLIGEGQLCAGYIDGGVDSCLGDSGGPLYTSVRGRVQLIGVTSFGRGCAEPNFYGIYTSVASERDWIRQYVALENMPRGTGAGTVGDVSGNSDDRSGIGAAWMLLALLAAGAGIRRIVAARLTALAVDEDRVSSPGTRA